MRTRTLDGFAGLVGITGAARAGKDTLGSGLALYAGFTNISFALPIRRFVADLMHLSVPEMEEIKEVPHPALGGKTPRFAMQTLGTDWGRNMIDPDLWIRDTMHRSICIRRVGTPVVITDVRFDSEAEAIRKAGGEVIKITRPGYGLSGDAAQHASEQGVSYALLSVELFKDCAGNSHPLQGIGMKGATLRQQRHLPWHSVM